MKELLHKQGWHGLALMILLIAAAACSTIEPVSAGSLWGIPTQTWYWITILIPVVHQVFVALAWRAQLHHKWLTNLFGKHALTFFGAVFIPLFAGRLILLFLLGISNTGSLPIPPWLRLTLAAAFTLPSLYLGYSVGRYFGLKRALGADHFDPAYRELPMVTEGIFKYTSNGMYVFGFFVLWAVAFGFASSAALIGAAFNHAYIWVHYLTVEQPDMGFIYG